MFNNVMEVLRCAWLGVGAHSCMVTVPSPNVPGGRPWTTITAGIAMRASATKVSSLRCRTPLEAMSKKFKAVARTQLVGHPRAMSLASREREVTSYMARYDPLQDGIRMHGRGSLQLIGIEHTYALAKRFSDNCMAWCMVYGIFSRT